VHTGAAVEGCVIMDNCDIGRHAKLRRAILDKNVHIPADTQVGYDLEADRARGWHVTSSGIVVIGRQ
jgi:glucose-1-phosphate adenylyltransferase